MNIKTIKERWEAIKALLKCDEYFLAISHKPNFQNVIEYNYYNQLNSRNSVDKNCFYEIIKSHIEDNLMNMSGKFVCIRNYEDHNPDIFIMKGTEMAFNKGWITVMSNGNSIQYHVPPKEILSHFKFISD